MQDPKKRATAQQILQHEWMKENGTASDKPLDNVILNRMRGFAGMNKLKKEALKVIATGMSPEEIAGLRALFEVDDSSLQWLEKKVHQSLPCVLSQSIAQGKFLVFQRPP